MNPIRSIKIIARMRCVPASGAVAVAAADKLSARAEAHSTARSSRERLARVPLCVCSVTIFAARHLAKRHVRIKLDNARES